MSAAHGSARSLLPDVAGAGEADGGKSDMPLMDLVSLIKHPRRSMTEVLKDRQLLLLAEELARQRFHGHEAPVQSCRSKPVYVKGSDGEWHRRSHRRRPRPPPPHRALPGSELPALHTPRPPPPTARSCVGTSPELPQMDLALTPAPPPASFEAELLRRARERSRQQRRQRRQRARQQAEVDAVENAEAIDVFMRLHGDTLALGSRGHRVHRAARGTVRAVEQMRRTRPVLLQRLRGTAYAAAWQSLAPSEVLAAYCQAAGDRRYRLTASAFEQVQSSVAAARPEAFRRGLRQDPAAVEDMFTAVDGDFDGRASCTDFIMTVALLRVSSTTARLLDRYFIALGGSRHSKLTAAHFVYERQLDAVLPRAPQSQYPRWEEFCRHIADTVHARMGVNTTWVFGDLVEHVFFHYHDRGWSLDRDLGDLDLSAVPRS